MLVSVRSHRDIDRQRERESESESESERERERGKERKKERMNKLFFFTQTKNSFQLTQMLLTYHLSHI